MAVRFRRLLRGFLVLFGRLLCHLLFRVTIEGREYAPVRPQGLLVISNHFSWFDAPILSLLLPYPPAYLVATEAMATGWIRTFTMIFESIPIWRGQVDRQALTTAVQRLKAGEIVGIFPEGGINPELADLVAAGHQIHEFEGNMARVGGVLIRAKPGVSILATMSGVPILPVALLGSETVLDEWRRWRRPALIIRIGPSFGPLIVDSALKGAARRAQMDELAHVMMRQVAALFPPEQRGYYRETGASATAVTVGGSGVKM